MDAGEAVVFPLEIRFSDLDAMGHVNNAVYFTYFEEGRKKLFFSHLRSDTEREFNFILAGASCNYRLPLLLEDRAVLEMRVGTVGTKSFTFKYAIRDEANPAKIYADGETTLVSFDYKAMKSVPISDATRAALDKIAR